MNLVNYPHELDIKFTSLMLKNTCLEYFRVIQTIHQDVKIHKEVKKLKDFFLLNQFFFNIYFILLFLCFNFVKPPHEPGSRIPLFNVKRMSLECINVFEIAHQNINKIFLYALKGCIFAVKLEIYIYIFNIDLICDFYHLILCAKSQRSR